MTTHATFPDFTLRDLAREDGAAFQRYLNDLSVARWLSRTPYPYRATDAEEFLDAAPSGWPRRAAIDVGGKLVGVVSIDPHLGYWLAPEHQGRGIATRAAAALVGAFFAGTDAQRIASGVFEGNAASARVLARLGFRETGRGVEFCRPLGVARPHIGFQLTRADWNARADTMPSARPRATGAGPLGTLSDAQSRPAAGARAEAVPGES